MGTNYYLRMKDSVEVHPEFHIAKRSYGCLPSFEANNGGCDVARVYFDRPAVNSVDDIRFLVESGEWEIYNEYDEYLTLDEFTEDVLMWNGGNEDVGRHKHDENDWYMSYFRDSEGFNFARHEFC